MDDVTTMRPYCWAFIRMKAAFTAKNVPFRLTAWTWSQSASVMTSMRVDGKMPALLTRMSSRPKRSTAFWVSASASDHRETSARQKSASPPARRISSTTALPARGSRPTISTLAPSAAKTWAIPLPMPRLEPVITAVLAFNLPAISNPSVTDGSWWSLESRQRSSIPLYRQPSAPMKGACTCRSGMAVPTNSRTWAAYASRIAVPPAAYLQRPRMRRRPNAPWLTALLRLGESSDPKLLRLQGTLPQPPRSAHRGDPFPRFSSARTLPAATTDVSDHLLFLVLPRSSPPPSDPPL